MPRSRDVEQRFLARAAGTQHPEFVVQATRRLDLGQELYGDEWEGRSIESFLEELLEEAADLGAWAALAIQTTRDPGVVQLLELAAQYGARAHEALAIAYAVQSAAATGA